MPRYCIHMTYDGSAYCGYQRQAGNLATIQAVLEDRFEEAFHLPIVLHASGRTDAGVHARNQVAHFDLPVTIPREKLVYAWNRQLPRNIRILDAYPVAEDFHARKHAIGKRYSYRVYFGRMAPAIGYAYFTTWPYPIEIASIQESLAPLVGHHDFSAFCCEGSSVQTFERRLDLARFDYKAPWGAFVFMGQGFLRHMVRIIVGSALDVASGGRPVDAISQALATGRREIAGQTAPATGLFLEEVYYDPDDYFAACDEWERRSIYD